MILDLTPFGFTPTEATAYQRLLALGPSSGYSVAKDAGLARANAYAALDGLVAKVAALLEGTTPKLYRPVAPDALLARITVREARKLERLEEDVARVGVVGAPSTVAVSGEREFRELVLRTGARHEGAVWFLGPGDMLAALAPVWRKRQADGYPTSLFTTDAKTPALPIALAGTVEGEEVLRLFGGQLSLLLTSGAAIAGLEGGAELAGIWTSDPLLLGLLRVAAEFLTGDRIQA